MTNKIKVLYFLYKNKRNKQNKAPIYCRLTLNKKRRHFSTGFFISIVDWNVTTHSVHNSNILASPINTKLSILERRIMDITLKYEVNGREYTLDEIWNEVNGKAKDNVKGLLQSFDMHNDNMELLVGKSHSMATVKKFKSIRKQLKEFILFQYKQDDILLSNIKMKFLTDFEYYMLTEKDMKQISINKTIQRMRKIIKFSIANEYLEKDPFLLYKAKSVRIEVVYLTPEELSKLESYMFDSDRLMKVRDCFVFCCYTGLPYQEMADLRE
ncbi:MAG: phage integrase SAM-like domain-containing protein, partial [Saprospiraceae bacterium]